MNRFPLPGDVQMEALIRVSFEAMPGPDMRRLEQLESRLARTAAQNKRRTVNTLPWWIVLLLTGGFATASWWVVDRIFRDPYDEKAVLGAAPEQRAAVREDNQDSSRPSQEVIPLEAQTEEQKSPVIYTRENF